MRLLTRWISALLIAATGAWSTASLAGDPVLTVSGNVTATSGTGSVALDLEALEAMPSDTFTTTTIWTEGAHEFTGVPLVALLEALGASGSVLKATALNDYSVEIPVSDAVAGGPIVAYLMDGREMSVRDKGPLWIVYPYDNDADYRTETVYSRSIWQLDRLEVIE